MPCEAASGDKRRHTTAFERGGRVAIETFTLAPVFRGETELIGFDHDGPGHLIAPLRVVRRGNALGMGNRIMYNFVRRGIVPPAPPALVEPARALLVAVLEEPVAA